jgi:hypothetical protein
MPIHRGLLLVFAASALAGCIVVQAPPNGPPDAAPPADVVVAAPVDGSTDDARTTPPDAPAGADAASDSVFVPAPHTPFPVVPPNDHAVMDNPRLVTIVSSSESADARARLAAWGDGVGASTWWAAVSSAYGLGAVRSNTTVIGPAITNNMTGANMVAYIDAIVAAHPSAAPDGQTMYLLYLPPGIASVNGSTGAVNTNCANDLGVHTTYHAGGDAWAWIQRCPTPPNTDAVEQSMTTASHEFAEAATDLNPPHGFAIHRATPGSITPAMDTPWLELGAEIGDLCAGSREQEGPLAFQRVWSVGAAAAGGDPCIPALPRPYYNVTAPAEWTAFGARRTLTIPLTGWSTGPRGDWYVAAQVYEETTTNDFTLDLAGSPDATGMINNGVTLTLTVTAPAGATSGDWATIKILTSEPMDPPPPPYPVPPDRTDRFHEWWIGVYFP